MPDLCFQVAGAEFISCLCHTGHIHSLTTLKANPQVTAKAGLCLLQGKEHRDVFPRCRERSLCVWLCCSQHGERGKDRA